RVALIPSLWRRTATLVGSAPRERWRRTMTIVWDKPDSDATRVALSKLETDLGLPPGFCEGLHEEDDWSLIIKLHALFESVVTQMLASHLGQEALLDVFDKIEMGREDTGKLAFAKALNLLDGNQRGFVRVLSRLRNDVVHDVRKVTFDLSAHVASI